MFCVVQSAERKAMIGAKKCMYWLCREEVLQQITLHYSMFNHRYYSPGAIMSMFNKTCREACKTSPSTKLYSHNIINIFRSTIP